MSAKALSYAAFAIVSYLVIRSLCLLCLRELLLEQGPFVIHISNLCPQVLYRSLLLRCDAASWYGSLHHIGFGVWGLVIGV